MLLQIVIALVAREIAQPSCYIIIALNKNVAAEAMIRSVCIAGETLNRVASRSTLRLGTRGAPHPFIFSVCTGMSACLIKYKSSVALPSIPHFRLFKAVILTVILEA